MKMWIVRDQGIRNIEGALFLYVKKQLQMVEKCFIPLIIAFSPK